MRPGRGEGINPLPMKILLLFAFCLFEFLFKLLYIILKTLYPREVYPLLVFYRISLIYGIAPDCP